MQFHSYSFLLAFLPLVLSAFFLAGGRYGKAVLLGGSLLFCWFCDPRSVLFLLASILVNFGLSLLIRRGKGAKLWLVLGLIVNLGVLAFSKYTNFAIDLTNALLHRSYRILDLWAPVGISFLTFQQTAWLIDVYRREASPEFSANGLADYAIYTSFFPHLIQGPILTHGYVLPALKEKSTFKVSWENLQEGFLLLSMGLAKKVLLADRLGKAVDYGYLHPETITSLSGLYVVISYTLQLYFDFSGYCDIAQGIGLMLNLKLPANFNSPLKALTVAEFWRRWHMTLTGFLTRYVYIPLGGSRKGQVRTALNTMIVFLLSGLWHGASISFVLWGGIQGIGTICSKWLWPLLKKLPNAVNCLLTFLFFGFSLIFFRAGSLHTAAEVLRGILRPGISFPEEMLEYGMPASLAFLGACLLIVFVFPNAQELAGKWKKSLAAGVAAGAVLAVCILSLQGVSSYLYEMF